MEQNFKIDFLMLEKLAESCFSGKTILEYLVLQELVDKHFEIMSEGNRKAFFDYFSRKYRTDGKFLDGETDFIWRLILARYNPQNRFRIGKDTKTLYFHFENKYYRNTRQFVEVTDNLEVVRLTKTHEE